MDVSQLEKASIDSWPALQDVAINGGVLRYAKGVSKRANSLVLSCDALCVPAALVDLAEQFYRSKSQCVSIRVCALPELKPNTKPSSHLNIDAELASRGYEKTGQTAVMVNSSIVNRNSENSVRCAAQLVPITEWLAGHYALKNLPLEEFDTHLLMLKKINIPSCFLVVRDQDKKIIATGYATLSGYGIGIYGMATHSCYRNTGLATGLLRSLELWGQKLNAKMLYLQVESANAAALGLYQKFGFTKKYDYWYRIAR